MIMCVSVIFLTTAVGTTERQVKLPILMYHNLSKNQKSLSKYTISPTEFENDMKYIQENGYTTVNLQELIAFTEGANLPEKPIIITFDDGYESVYEYAYPILKERNMHAVINILGKYTQIYSNSDDHNVNYAHITFAQIKEMTKSGLIEIGNHSYDLHKTQYRVGIERIGGESLDEYKKMLTDDLTKTQNLLKENTGIVPIAFAYPFGKSSKCSLDCIKKMGFLFVFCCWEKANILTGEKEELLHLNRFNRPHGKSAQKILGSI